MRARAANEKGYGFFKTREAQDPRDKRKGVTKVSSKCTACTPPSDTWSSAAKKNRRLERTTANGIREAEHQTHQQETRQNVATSATLTTAGALVVVAERGGGFLDSLAVDVVGSKVPTVELLNSTFGLRVKLILFPLGAAARLPGLRAEEAESLATEAGPKNSAPPQKKTQLG